jgi:hypothetical protein
MPVQKRRTTMSSTPRKTLFFVVMLATLLFQATPVRSAGPASDPHDNGDPSAPAGDENAQLRSELEQLKQLVQQQQARITALEYQHSGITAGEGAGGAVTDMPSPPIGAGPDRVPPSLAFEAELTDATTQTQQNAGSSDERIRNLERRIKGIGPLSFSGDVRLREEPFFGGPSDGSLDRARARMRARFNIFADLSDQFQAGISLASGDVNDPTSTNQTLGVFYSRKAFALDQAYVNYDPSWFKPLTLTAGKFRYPWYNTELTWDKDLNPEGAAQTLAFNLNNTPVLKRVAVVGFELPFAEVAGTGIANKNIVQSMAYGTQVQTTWALAPHVQFSAYTGYYDFQNADAIAEALAKASAKNPQTPWVGSLPLGTGNTPQNSITTTASANIVTVNGKAFPTGVTNIVNAQFGSKFGLFDTLARLDWDTGNVKLPVTVLGDYVQNTRACANAGNIQHRPANNASLIFTQATNFPCKANQRRGYWLEARVGRLLEKGDWQAGYTRIYIEREAVISNFDYSELRQGSNVTEHRFDMFYMFQKSVQVGFTALIGRPLGANALARTEPWLSRLQFDTAYVF